MKTKYAFIICLVSAIALSACSKQENHRGSGSVVSENRNVHNFDAVELQHSGEVTIYQDSVFSVEVSDYHNIVHYTLTEVVGNRLVIRVDNHVNLKNSKARIIIHMPKLVSLRLGGSGHIETIGRFDNFNRIDISGSGNIVAHDIHSNDYMNVHISGSGKIRANGSCKVLDMSISGSGAAQLFNLPCDSSYADVSGSGSIEVSVDEFIDAHVSGSGNIIYQGNPVIRSTISGSGSIRKR